MDNNWQKLWKLRKKMDVLYCSGIVSRIQEALRSNGESDLAFKIGFLELRRDELAIAKYKLEELKEYGLKRDLAKYEGLKRACVRVGIKIEYSMAS